MFILINEFREITEITDVVEESDIRQFIEIPDDLLPDNIIDIEDPKGHAKFKKYILNQDGSLSVNAVRICPVTKADSTVIESHYVTSQFDIDRNFVGGKYTTPSGMIAHDIDFEQYRGIESNEKIKKYELLNNSITSRDITLELDNVRVSKIKSKAGEIIEGSIPDWKQRNLIARMTELLLTMQTSTLTTDESAELLTLQNLWAWVKNVRDTSDQAENSGLSVDAVIWPNLP